MILKSFQIRAARSVLGLGVREVGNYINVSRTTISIWERQEALQTIQSKKSDVSLLITLFKEYGIIFPDTATVTLVTNNLNNSKHLTRFQLRASRAALSLTQEELSGFTKIPIQIITYLESKKNDVYINTTPKEFNESLLKSFFEKQNIKFLNDFSITLTKNPNIKKNVDSPSQIASI